MTFLRSRLSRWLSAVAAVAGVALVIGQCQRGETAEEVPTREAGLRPTRTSTKAKLAIPPDIAAWSKRYAVQKAPPEELRADPELKTGTFGNGVRYIVVEHPGSAGEVSLRLMVLAGSMHEWPGEEGYAHFIEHLAFQEEGGGHAFEVFEKLGLASGADLNAHTALDHTLYRLDLPAADDAMLETACGFLGRAAGGMNFSDAKVDGERRVILRELDERPESERFFQKAAAILPGVPVLMKPPGGTHESVRAARRGGLMNFWQRNYVPSRMVVVAVGDLKEELMVERLRRHFGGITSRSAPVETDLGDPMIPGASPVTVIKDEDESEVEFAIATPYPIDHEPDSLEKRRQELVRGVALKMLENHIEREFGRVKSTGMSVKGSEVDVMPGMGWLQVTARANREDAPGVLKSLVSAWRLGVGCKFHPSEFSEACGEVRAGLRQEFLSRISQDTADLATRLADSERTGRLVESPEDELNRYLVMLRTVTREECEDLLRTEWAVPARVLVSGDVDSYLERSAARIVANAMAEPVERYGQGTLDRAWVAQPPAWQGKVIRRELDQGRGYLEAELSNHILVRLAPIPSLGGFVRVQVDTGYGHQSLPPEKPALATAAQLICMSCPLKNWSHFSLNAALGDEDVTRRFDVEWNSFRWVGDTDRKQLRRQLDLLAALVEQPGLADMPRIWRPEAQTQAWDERVRKIFSGKMKRAVQLQNGFDPRFEYYPEGLMETDSTQVAEWLLPLLAGERLCVSLAGDFEPEVALAEVVASFSGLPERPVWEEASRYPPPPLPQPGVSRMPLGKREVGAVVLMFPLGPADDADEMLRRQLLEELLQLRVRDEIRERRGDSYAPRVERSMFADHGMEWLFIDVACAKGRAEEMSVTLRELVRGFRDEGWTSDEFQRAVRPMPHWMARRARNPVSVLESLRNPSRMPAPEQFTESALEAMEGEVRALARRVLDPEAAVELQVDG